MASRSSNALVPTVAASGLERLSGPVALTRPAGRRTPLHTILQLLAYYGALVLIGSLFPLVQGAVSLHREPMPAAIGKLFEVGSQVVASSRLALLTTLSMMAALTLAIPIAWVHSMTKPAGRAERSVAETLVILPVAVAAIAIMVQNSLPLAFSLAGIVAAVRFRNTLKDANDAVYVFVAIGIGLAAGVQAVAVATVLSALFSAVVLAMSSLKLAGASSGLAPNPAAEPRRPQDDSGEDEESHGEKRGSAAAALLVVRAAPCKPTWRAVEDVLGRHARRWRLMEPPAGADEEAPLEYQVRLKRKASPAEVLEEIRRRGGADIIGVELRLFAGEQTARCPRHPRAGDAGSSPTRAAGSSQFAA